MAANLEGIRFDQIYGDNSGTHNGQQPFDTDGDGTATQEDEFVSITNSTGAPMDISGWQIWSDSAGTGAPDAPQDGLYHTFPPGTVLQPGETLYIINEISGDTPDWAQEASEGGVESGAGGESTNFLSEGSAGTDGESVALVNPQTGEYIVFNMSSEPPNVQNISGFPGTTNVGTEDGDAQMADQPAGSSYRHNADSDSYEPSRASVPCYASGTMIDTPDGPRAVETLRPGHLVLTLDHGPQAIRWTRSGDHPLEEAEDEAKPVLIQAGALGAGRPAQDLIVSPQHRILVGGGGQLTEYFDKEVFAPAKALTELPGIRHMKGKTKITYVHFACDRHEVVIANGCLSESLLLGPMVVNGLNATERGMLTDHFGPPAMPGAALNGPIARECLKVGEVRRHLAKCKKEEQYAAAKEIHKWDVDLAMEQWETDPFGEAITIGRKPDFAIAC